MSGPLLAIIFGFLWVRQATREVRAKAPPPLPEPEAAAPGHAARVYSGGEAEEIEDDHHERYSRNKFLELSTLGIGAAIGAVVTIPVVGFAVAPSFINQNDEEVDLGPITNFPDGKFVVTTFYSREGEQKVNLRTAYIRSNGFVNEVPSFTILSSRCVHLGCPVQPSGPLDQPKDIETDSGKVTLTPVTTGRVQLPLSRRCVRHGREPDGRPAGALTRPVLLQHPERQPGARGPLQRRHRCRNRGRSADCFVPGLRPGRARRWARGLALPLLTMRNAFPEWQR